MTNLEKFFKEKEKEMRLAFDEVNDIFEVYRTKFKPDSCCTVTGDFPKVNVIEYHNKVKIVAALTGFSKDQIDISLSGKAITITSNSNVKNETTDADRGFLIREIKTSKFRRTINLPSKNTYNTSGVKANFENGLLTIEVPKVNVGEVEEPSLTIKID